MSVYHRVMYADFMCIIVLSLSLLDLLDMQPEGKFPGGGGGGGAGEFKGKLRQCHWLQKHINLLCFYLFILHKINPSPAFPKSRSVWQNVTVHLLYTSSKKCLQPLSVLFSY